MNKIISDIKKISLNIIFYAVSTAVSRKKLHNIEKNLFFLKIVQEFPYKQRN